MNLNEFKKIAREYFTFSRSERVGITVLGILLVVSIVLNVLVDHINFIKPTDYTETRQLLEKYTKQSSKPEIIEYQTLFEFNPNTIGEEMLDSLELPQQIKLNLLKYRERGGFFRNAGDFGKLYGVTDSLLARLVPYISIETRESNFKPNYYAKPAVTYVKFDPNIASDDELKQLGFTAFQRKNVISFREKGGTFRKKEDLKKIYGIDSILYENIENWIEIAEVPTAKPVISEIKIVELNSTDSLELVKLPGIGPYFAGRIIKLRQQLGGFYSKNQLLDVYGMTPEKLDQSLKMFTVDSTQIKTIRLNFADVRQLNMHPYISYEQAKQIVKFRSSDGPYKSVQQLADKKIIDQVTLDKLKPYLVCN